MGTVFGWRRTILISGILWCSCSSVTMERQSLRPQLDGRKVSAHFSFDVKRWIPQGLAGEELKSFLDNQCANVKKNVLQGGEAVRGPKDLYWFYREGTVRHVITFVAEEALE